MLHLANRDIPYAVKEQFYAIKKSILLKYGKHIRDDWQHIVKECYSCDGTGVFYPEYRRPEPCWNCNKGIYQQFIVQLSVYRFGKYEFHVPKDRKYISRGDTLPNYNYIKGFIRHKAPKYHIGYECGLWLLLMYDFTSFKRAMRMSLLYSPRTPLVCLKAIMWRFRHKKWNKFFKRKNKKNPIPNFYHADDLPF